VGSSGTIKEVHVISWITSLQTIVLIKGCVISGSWKAFPRPPPLEKESVWLGQIAVITASSHWLCRCSMHILASAAPRLVWRTNPDTQIFRHSFISTCSTCWPVTRMRQGPQPSQARESLKKLTSILTDPNSIYLLHRWELSESTS
jgi:hypothetical protein